LFLTIIQNENEVNDLNSYLNLKLDIIVVVFQEDSLEVCRYLQKKPFKSCINVCRGHVHFQIDLFSDLEINFMVFRDHLNHNFNIQYLNFYIEL